MSRDELDQAFARLADKAKNPAVPMAEVKRDLEAFMNLDAPAEVLHSYRIVLGMAFEQRSPRHNPGVPWPPEGNE